MEDAQTNILPVQPQPLSPISEASVENQNTNMSRNAGADSYTVNESPDITFNTGVSTFTKKADVYLVGAQEVHF